ncbi:hypothetical protein RRF57_008625 [Xylaria bambusicola]|uniref:Uncharacterized protein n=1 Tax=Xylaria bambusicola TaxID=326684 RepID=A0AAN7UU74_9PEZI
MLGGGLRGGWIVALLLYLLLGESHDTRLLNQYTTGRIRNQEVLRHLVCLENISTAENYVSSFHGNFRYEIGNAVTPDDFDSAQPLWKTTNAHHGYLFKYLLPALRGETKFCFILDSKLATVQFLTLCLAVALTQADLLKLIEKLIEKGANTADNTVLMCAIRRNPGIIPTLVDNTGQQRNLVTKGLKTDILKDAILQGPNTATHVHYYIKSGSVDIFDTGPSPPESTDPALTPLGVAIRLAESYPQYSYDIVELLLGHGCDPNSIVSFDEWRGPHTNKTAMVQAVAVGNKELVQLLIARGAHVNPVLRHMVRRTPLQQAAEKGDLEMARLLIAHGADVNAAPCIALGGTALQLAAISGNCELAAELLQHGALLMPPPKIGGRWPIEGAAEHSRIEMIQFLVCHPQSLVFPVLATRGGAMKMINVLLISSEKVINC